MPKGIAWPESNSIPEKERPALRSQSASKRATGKVPHRCRQLPAPRDPAPAAQLQTRRDASAALAGAPGSATRHTARTAEQRARARSWDRATTGRLAVIQLRRKPKSVQRSAAQAATETLDGWGG